MILPPRPQNQPQPTRRARELDPPPRRIVPQPERFAPPPWDRHSPQWLDIEDDLDADHLARAIDVAVDHLDLTALFASYAGVGSRAHWPDLMLKIVLDEIQTGRHSPDQWSQDVLDRRSVRWLGFGITPSRTRCYAFRDRIGPLLELYNRQVLELAVVQGLTTARRGSLDGTLIAANASRHRLVNLARLERRLAELDRVLAADKTGQNPGTIPGWMARSPGSRRRQRYRFGVARRTLLKHHAQNARRPSQNRQDPAKIVLSTSDVEAALGLDKEKVFRPLSNLQIVPDLESPPVLGYEVFAQSTDAGTLMPLRQRVHDLTGVWLDRALADSTYASALDLFDCAAVGLDLYAPYQENDQTEQRRAQHPHRVIPKSQFVWRPEEQCYVCPRGHRLRAMGQERRARAGERSVVLLTDRCPKEHGQACPLAARCTRDQNGRTIKRNEHEDLIVALQAKMQTAEAKAIYRQRGQTIELRFADAKAHRGLRRFSGRGLTRVRIEAGLLVLAHNLLVVQAAEERKAAERQNGTSCQDAA
jgi:transposase